MNIPGNGFATDKQNINYYVEDEDGEDIEDVIIPSTKPTTQHREKTKNQDFFEKIHQNLYRNATHIPGNGLSTKIPPPILPSKSIQPQSQPQPQPSKSVRPNQQPYQPNQPQPQLNQPNQPQPQPQLNQPNQPQPQLKQPKLHQYQQQLKQIQTEQRQVEKEKIKTFDDILKKMRVQYVDNQLQYQPQSIAPPIIYEESYPSRVETPWTEEQIKQHIMNEKVKKRIIELRASQIKSRKLILPSQNIQISRGSDDMNRLFGFVGRK
jgi:hypothetical protein